MRRTMALAAALGALAVAPAVARASDVTFDGQCDNIAGSATFDQPIGGTTVMNDGYHFTGSGTCTGTLNGAKVSAAPVNLKVDGHGDLNCNMSKSTDDGPGSITFTQGTADPSDDVVLPFTLTFTGTGPRVDYTIKGLTSGTATGAVTFVTPTTPPDLAAQCAQQQVSKLPFDSSLGAPAKTATPLVSPGPAAAEKPATTPATTPTTTTPPASTTAPASTPKPAAKKHKKKHKKHKKHARKHKRHAQHKRR